jgi:site-specific recombinase XerD
MLPFSQTDIELIKENAKTIRDKAIVCFLLSTGARINEVCSLNRGDIDFQSMEATVLGKGNKERTVYLDTVTAMLLKRYFDSRTDTCPALFAGKRNERLTPDGVRRMLKVIEKNSGVENVHPHRFRRTLATRLIDHGMTITEVAAILGHESLNVTSRYVYVEKQNVKNNYNRYA